VIEIEKDNRFHDNKYVILIEKMYYRIKIWYRLFFGICIMNLILYILKIHNNYALVIYIPFWHCPITFLLLIVLQLKSEKSVFDYLERYYPEISEKIWINGRGNGLMNKLNYGKFYKGEYIEKGIDPVIDSIRNKKNITLLLFVPFMFLIIFTIIAEFFKR
jgi:hypothetical protein